MGANYTYFLEIINITPRKIYVFFIYQFLIYMGMIFLWLFIIVLYCTINLNRLSEKDFFAKKNGMY